MPTFTATSFGQNIMSPQSAGEVMVMEEKVALPDTLDAGDFVKFGYLPAGCVMIDMIVAADELDTHGTDTLRINVGLLNATGDDLVAASLMVTAMKTNAAVNVVRAGAVATDVAMLDTIAPTQADRVVAAKITAAAETAAAGDLRVKMFYRASVLGA